MNECDKLNYQDRTHWAHSQFILRVILLEGEDTAFAMVGTRASWREVSWADIIG